MNTLCNRCMYCIPVTVEHEKKKNPIMKLLPVAMHVNIVLLIIICIYLYLKRTGLPDFLNNLVIASLLIYIFL